eukprot:TRINITY_DN1097_c0_g2_i1.p1 TRINITY_DN1097_c0_g2~~TRINITY_DN1097_c0_g2_i1.p1  ORF type:complete len:3588 (+),score=1056.47 TRINITY_DN1097_c0_g2_i1:122-10885(+)
MSAEVSSADGNCVSFGDRVFLSNVFYFGYLYGQVRSDGKPQMNVDAHPQVLEHRSKRSRMDDTDAKLCRRELRHFERALIEIARPGDFGTDTSRFGNLMYGQTVRLKHVFSGLYITIHSNELPDIMGARFGITVHDEHGGRASTITAELCPDLSKDDDSTSQQFRILPKYSKIRKEGDSVRIGDQIILQHFDSGRVLASAQAEPAEGDTIEEVMTSRGKNKASVHLVALLREGSKKKDTAIWTLHGFTRRTGEAAEREYSEQMAVRVGSVVSLHHVETDCFLSLVPGEVPKAKWLPSLPVPMPVWQKDEEPEGKRKLGQKNIFVEPRSEMSANFSSYHSLWIVESETSNAKVGGGAPHGGVVTLHRPNKGDAVLYRLRHLATDTYLTADEKGGHVSLTTLEAHKLTDKNTTLVRFVPDLSMRGDDPSKAHVVGCSTLSRIQFYRQRLYLHVRKNRDVTLLERYEYEDLFMLRPQPIAQAYDLSKMTEAADLLKLGTMFQPGQAKQSARAKRKLSGAVYVDPVRPGGESSAGEGPGKPESQAGTESAMESPAGTEKEDAGGDSQKDSSSPKEITFRGLSTATVVSACRKVLEHIERETEQVIKSVELRHKQDEEGEGDNLILCRQRLLLDMRIHVLCFRVLLWCKYVETNDSAAREAETPGDSSLGSATSTPQKCDAPDGFLSPSTPKCAAAVPGRRGPLSGHRSPSQLSAPARPNGPVRDRPNLCPLTTLCYRLLKQLCYNDGSFKVESTAAILYHWVPLIAYLIGGASESNPQAVASTETGLKLMMTILKARPRSITDRTAGSTRTLKLVLDHLVPYLTDSSHPIPKLFKDTTRIAVLTCLCVSSSGASQAHHQQYLCATIKESRNALLYLTRVFNGQLQVFIPSGAQNPARPPRREGSSPPTAPVATPGSDSSPPQLAIPPLQISRLRTVSEPPSEPPDRLNAPRGSGGDLLIVATEPGENGRPTLMMEAGGGSRPVSRASEQSNATLPIPPQDAPGAGEPLQRKRSSMRFQKASLRRLGADWVDLPTFMVRWPLESTAYFAATRELLYSLAYQNAWGAEYVRSCVSVAEVLHGCLLTNPSWTCPWSTDDHTVNYPTHHYTDPLKAAYVRICRAAYVGGHPSALSTASREKKVNVNPNFPESPPIVHHGQTLSSALSIAVDDCIIIDTASDEADSNSTPWNPALPVRFHIASHYSPPAQDEGWAVPPKRYRRRSAIIPTGIADPQCSFPRGDRLNTAHQRQLKTLFRRHKLLMQMAGQTAPAFIEQLSVKACGGQATLPAGQSFGADPSVLHVVLSGEVKCGSTNSIYQGPFFADCSLLPTGGPGHEYVALTTCVMYEFTTTDVYTILRHCHETQCTVVKRAMRAVAASGKLAMSRLPEMTVWEYEHGDTVVNIGDTLDKVYVVLYGCLDVMQEGADKDSGWRRVDASGHLFCDVVLQEPPSACIVAANGDTSLGVITKAAIVAAVKGNTRLWEEQFQQSPPISPRSQASSLPPAPFDIAGVTRTLSMQEAKKAVLNLTAGELSSCTLQTIDTDTDVLADDLATSSETASARSGDAGGEEESPDPCKDPMWPWMRQMLVRGLKQALRKFLDVNQVVDTGDVARNVLVAEWLQLLSDLLELGVYSDAELRELLPLLANLLDPSRDMSRLNPHLEEAFLFPHPLCEHTGAHIDVKKGGTGTRERMGSGGASQLPSPSQTGKGPGSRLKRGSVVGGFTGSALRLDHTVSSLGNTRRGSFMASQGLSLGLPGSAKDGGFGALGSREAVAERPSNDREIVNRVKLEVCKIFTKLFARRMLERRAVRLDSEAEDISERLQGILLCLMQSTGGHDVGSRKLLVYSIRLYLLISAHREGCQVTDPQARRGVVAVLREELKSIGKADDGMGPVSPTTPLHQSPHDQDGSSGRFLIRLIEHCRQMQLSSVADEGLSREAEDETLLAALGCLRDVVDLPEDEADEADGTLEMRQDKLNSIGIMRLVINTIGANWAEDGLDATNEDIVKSGLDLAVSLLEGGNINVQRWLQEYFLSRRDENLFVVLRDRITKAISTLDKSVNLAEKLENDSSPLTRGGKRRHGTTPQSPNGGLTGSFFDHEKLSPVSPMFAGPLYHIKETMRFLQLCSEGHNTEMQHYLRRQEDNVQSHDLVRHSLKFLTSLNAVARPSRGMQMADFCVDIATQTWNTLSEFCQGPVPENQTALVEGFIGRDVNKVFEIKGVGLDGPGLVSEMRNAAVITVLSVCEGCTTPHIPLTLRYTLNLKVMLKHILAIPEAERSTTEFGFNIYLLFCFLRDYDPYDRPTSVSKMLDPNMCANAAAQAALRFYKDYTAQVEIMRDAHGLERVYFKKPAACLLLDKQAKKLNAVLNRDTHQSRLMDFFDRVEETMYELELLAKMRKQAHDAGQRRGVIKLFQRFFFKNHERARHAATYLVLLCNALLLSTSAVGSTHAIAWAEWWEEWYMGPPVCVNDSYELPYIFSVVLSWASMMLLCHFVFELVQFMWFEGPVLSFAATRYKQRKEGKYSVAQFLSTCGGRGAQKDWARNVSLDVASLFKSTIGTGVCGRLLVSITACLLAQCMNVFWLSILMIPLIHESNVIRHVFHAVTRNGHSLLLTAMLGVILMYLFAVVGFVMFRDKFADPSMDGQTPCTTMFRCLVFTVTKGVPAGGGIGELMQPSRWGSELHGVRLLYDMLFYVLITVIFMNIVFGIIVDTFGELRQKREAREQEMRTRCFICNVESSDFDKRADGFENHIVRDHNMWNYMFFVYYLATKPKDDLTGQESFVYNCILNLDLKFIPVNNSLTLAQNSVQNGAAEIKDPLGVSDEAREDLVAALLGPRMEALEMKLIAHMTTTDENIRQTQKMANNVGRLVQQLSRKLNDTKAGHDGNPDLWGKTKKLVIRSAGTEKVVRALTKQGSGTRLVGRGRTLRKAASAAESLRRQQSAKSMKESRSSGSIQVTPLLRAHASGMSEECRSPLFPIDREPMDDASADLLLPPRAETTRSEDLDVTAADTVAETKDTGGSLCVSQSVDLGKDGVLGKAAAVAKLSESALLKPRDLEASVAAKSAASLIPTPEAVSGCSGMWADTPSRGRLPKSVGAHLLSPWAGATPLQLQDLSASGLGMFRMNSSVHQNPIDVYQPSSPDTASPTHAGTPRVQPDTYEVYAETVEHRGRGDGVHQYKVAHDGFVFCVTLSLIRDALEKPMLCVDASRSAPRWDPCMVSWDVVLSNESGASVAADSSSATFTVGQLKALGEGAAGLGTCLSERQAVDVACSHTVFISVSLRQAYCDSPAMSVTPAEGATGSAAEVACAAAVLVVARVMATTHHAHGALPVALSDCPCVLIEEASPQQQELKVTHAAAPKALSFTDDPRHTTTLQEPAAGHGDAPSMGLAARLQTSVERKRQSLARLAKEQQREDERFAQLLATLKACGVSRVTPPDDATPPRRPENEQAPHVPLPDMQLFTAEPMARSEHGTNSVGLASPSTTATKNASPTSQFRRSKRRVSLSARHAAASEPSDSAHSPINTADGSSTRLLPTVKEGDHSHHWAINGNADTSFQQFSADTTSPMSPYHPHFHYRPPSPSSSEGVRSGRTPSPQ